MRCVAMLNETVPLEATLTVEEFAAKIKYHNGSVLRAIRDGRIHAIPFGQGWRIPAAEARRILASGLPYRSSSRVILGKAAK